MNSKNKPKVISPLADEYSSLLGILCRPFKRFGGISGLIRHIFNIGLQEAIRRMFWLLRQPICEAVNRFYDYKHKVDTCGHIKPANLDIDLDSQTYSEAYSPTPTKSLRNMLNAVSINLQDYSFIDYGCGKGRALLIAAEKPFRQILGVEHSAALTRIAEENIQVYKNGDLRSRSIEALCIDATIFEPPPGPCLFYFFSPFHGKILNRVVSCIQHSYQKNPRSMVIIFSEEENTSEIPNALFESIDSMKKIKLSKLPLDLGAPVPLFYALYANPESGLLDTVPATK